MNKKALSYVAYVEEYYQVEYSAYLAENGLHSSEENARAFLHREEGNEESQDYDDPYYGMSKL